MSDQPESQPPRYEEHSSGRTDTDQPSEPRQPTTTGAGVGERFKGALGVVHGAGETLRGNIIGAVDTLFGGKHEMEAASLAQRGREEVHTGAERMRGRSKGATAEAQSQAQPTQEREQARPQGRTAELQPQAAPQAAPRSQVQEPDQSREQGQPQRKTPPERAEEIVQPKDQGPPPVQQESSKPKYEKAGDLAGGTEAPETRPATSS